jgi:uncharacterized protein YecE (DUF72 family)
VEFRHLSWWREEVYQALAMAGLSFCNVSYPGLPEERVVNTDLFYLRMHGVPELFRSPYSHDALQELAASLPSVASAYIYFNNTMFEAGYSNALELKRLTT